MDEGLELGTCDMCNKEDVGVERRYFHYNIKCECHYPNHFEIVFHCHDCEPKEPETTTIKIPTELLSKMLA